MAAKLRPAIQSRDFLRAGQQLPKRLLSHLPKEVKLISIAIFNNNMAVRKIKPVTPGQRHKIASTFETITSATPEKSLLQPLKRSGGRNVNGQQTMRYIGGGHKKMYRVIDFLRNKDGMPATVKTIEYDPNRSSRIALVVYGRRRKEIHSCTGRLTGWPGSPCRAKRQLLKWAIPFFLSDIPLGTIIHNIELKPGKGAALARSAGTYAQLSARDGKYATIKLPSGETRLVLLHAVQQSEQSPMATITLRDQAKPAAHAGRVAVQG
jgi:large subunit ribosomal protein L2